MTRLINKIAGLSEKKLLVFFFLLALTIRFGVSLYSYIDIKLNDSNLFNNLYYIIALDIVDQGKLFYETDHPYKDVVGPVMPWLNALSIYIFGNNWLGIFFFTSLASSLIVVVIVKISLLLFDRTTTLLAGIWAGISPLYLYYVPTPGKDIWIAFFMIYLIYMLLKLFELQRFSYIQYLIFILFFVVSFHLDERYFIFTPFIFLYILYHETNHLKKFKITKLLLFTGLVMLLMVPWTVRNFHKYGKIVILTKRTERFTDKLFGYEKKVEYFSDDFTGIKGLYYIHDYQIDSVISGKKTITDGGYQIPDIQIEAMRNGQLPKPLTGMDAFWSRIITMFEPFQLKGRYERTGYFYYKKSFRQNIATFLFYGILFFFSFPGFYYLYQRNKNTFFLFLSTIIIYALIHAFTIPYTNWRYRLPLDAIFIIVGSFGVTKLLSTIKNIQK